MLPTFAAPGLQAVDRRWGFVTFNLVCLWIGVLLMASHLAGNGGTVAGLVLFGLFGLLLAQVVYGFTLAVTGWWVLRHGGDTECINHTLPAGAATDRLPATAIVMPICNEEVNRVFRAVQVMYESLQTTGHGAAFDFYILSDTSDLELWIAEEKSWFELCQAVQGFGRIFYRKRRCPVHHKSGNIADFCRRWGARYRFMIVLDADSVMSGATFVRLASLMVCNPQVGIIQTQTRLALGRSLFQRINQFAARAYGPMFAAGANFWQLDNANFYGHNAIVRLRPFMKFCAMPELPRAGSLGPRILSHDTVEAALIRRAGYAVWSAYDLEGSYEESPPHLLASLRRDRRWCHGNLQHLWFLLAPGLTVASRINLLLGILAYVSSPLWLLFLVLSPVLFIGENPHAHVGLLFGYVLSLLLVPKVLGAQLMVASPGSRAAGGGRVRIYLNVFAESLYAMMLAPILMLAHSQFVWSSCFGRGSGWGRQVRRDEAGPTWQECVRAHWGCTLLALAGLGLVAGLAPARLPWLLLVFLGPIVAIPFSRLLASNRLGLKSWRNGWFWVAEERNPPWELRQIGNPLGSSASPLESATAAAGDLGLIQVVRDPGLNALHVSLLHQRPQSRRRPREVLTALADALLHDGPAGLSPAEKRRLLWDAEALLAVHRQLWRSRLSDLHACWQQGFRS